MCCLIATAEKTKQVLIIDYSLFTVYKPDFRVRVVLELQRSSFARVTAKHRPEK